jgi:hypothetical protein
MVLGPSQVPLRAKQLSSSWRHKHNEDVPTPQWQGHVKTYVIDVNNISRTPEGANLGWAGSQARNNYCWQDHGGRITSTSAKLWITRWNSVAFSNMRVCYSLMNAIDLSSLKVDSRLLVINRPLQDFFLRSRQSLDENLGGRQSSQLLKP